ncbi:S-(hydroxymethyl)glutathione dehydrogenase [Pyricularia oryzae Y34]|uniref:S-(Hydroxymethyl)glutathione dehydrogenase n=2 Tax=Pyricularia oryzae TaxID=318829 RepID=A0AA97PRG6_PYRO3|nr:S-(hydroxymethyl)glutathione dehydrogenase [Pyricularia oryzae Y34]
MKAVVFEGPYKISVQDRPVPQLQDDKDIIVKVHASGLCGSELHSYRGIEESGSGFIMGHEFTGTVTEVGSAVKTVQTQTSRCEHSQLFGSAGLDGGQAEYVRVPFADGTVVKAPAEFAEDDKVLVLMADIWPTGYFGASNAFKLLEATPDPVVVVIGCGPVGLCAVVAALEHKPKHLFAIDGVDSRLDLARGLGAEPLNFVTDREGMFKRIMEVTGGRGVDAVVEVVGLKDALRTAFDILRPFGVISSIGVHSTELPWTAAEAYE